jgi:hypothetical protein
MKKRIKDQSAEKEKKPISKKKLMLICVIAAVVVLGVILAIILIPRTTLVKLDDGTYDRGAVINMYLTDEAFDFDPQKPITDDAQLKITRMLFEGLTTLKDNGKWESAIMDSYTENEHDRDGYSITIDLAIELALSISFLAPVLISPKISFSATLPPNNPTISSCSFSFDVYALSSVGRCIVYPPAIPLGIILIS